MAGDRPPGGVIAIGRDDRATRVELPDEIAVGVGDRPVDGPAGHEGEALTGRAEGAVEGRARGLHLVDDLGQPDIAVGIGSTADNPGFVAAQGVEREGRGRDGAWDDDVVLEAVEDERLVGGRGDAEGGLDLLTGGGPARSWLALTTRSPAARPMSARAGSRASARSAGVDLTPWRAESSMEFSRP